MSPISKPPSSSTSLSRSNSYGNALRRGNLKISDPIPIPREANGLGPQALPHQTETWTRRSSPPQIEAFNNAQTVAQQAADPRISSFNTTASLSTGPSKTSLSKQKGGGLRATIKKMFGARKKRDTITSTIEQPRQREVLSFITAPGPANEQLPLQRISSMPLQEVNRSSALGSHAPYVFDSNTSRPQQVRPRGSLDYHHKRRNTLNDNRLMADATADSTRQKRRSRSAGQLREIAAQEARNRDDEIMYWRRSIADSPIPTFMQSQSDTQGQASAGSGIAEATTNPDEPPITTDRHLHVMPSQTFDFGNLMGHNPEDDSIEQRLATLEVKIVDLELALTRLSGNDGAKAVILGKPPGRKRPSHASNQYSFRSDSSSGSVTVAKSTVSPEPTFLASPQPSPSHAPERQPSLSHRTHRTSAATTVRPSTAIRQSIPPSPVLDIPIQQNPSHHSPQHPASPAPANLDHIEKLMILLQREQSYRHKLEIKYKTLEHQIEQLQRSPPYAHFKTSMYPTPSPEETSVNFSLRQSSNSGSGGAAVKPPPPNLHFHSSQRDFSSRDGDRMSISTSSTNSHAEEEDDPYQEIYETPTESTHKFVSERDVVSESRNMI